jgi:hypothetical protein
MYGVNTNNLSFLYRKETLTKEKNLEIGFSDNVIIMMILCGNSLMAWI